MKCLKCNESAVFSEPSLCKKHFIDYFEQKVKKTIKKYSLLNKPDKVTVACSGGKDSTTTLYLLKKFGYQADALAINEGIKGYRDRTLKDLVEFCKKNSIELRMFSFKEVFGKELDDMLKQKNHPCTVCGTYRRYLMNKYSQGYDKIATGHNMDDESQAVLMNLMKGNLSLMWNSRPKTPKVKGFVQKIKPLYFCSEKEVAAYAFLKGFQVGFTECPYIDESFRNKVREALNKYESENKGSKENILKKHLQILKNTDIEKKQYNNCNECGEPCQDIICNACKLTKSFK